MRSKLLLCGFVSLLLIACNKNSQIVENPGKGGAKIGASSTTRYIIAQGKQYCDKNFYMPVQYRELAFEVTFDSSAIYTTTDPQNQGDINKLYGFSDNNSDHHKFSARFGWRWSDNALRLFAYVYNNGEVTSKELGTISIGVRNACSIRVEDANYLFRLNGNDLHLPRESSGETAIGYKLYPYFGGDETAPHDISILIHESVP